MTKQQTEAPLIKGYLPVRVNFPSDDPNDPDETFFYVKEHFGENSKNTLFVANSPFYPDILTNIMLRSLLGRFGDIDRITVVPNPRKEKEESMLWTTNKNLYPSYSAPNVCEGKFAQVTFSCQKEMKKALTSLQDVMTDEAVDDEEYPGLIIDKLEIQTLQDETQRKLSGDDDDEDDDDAMLQITPKKVKRGILAVADRYRQSLESISSRQALLDECNAVMQDYEDAEQDDREIRADTGPDDDGFITVTYSAQNVGSKRELEQGVTTTNRRKGGSKRQRKKKDVNGASELQDFYRFQQKETRRKTVQELRKKFEEDLLKVKKMKEARQYRPFS